MDTGRVPTSIYPVHVLYGMFAVRAGVVQWQYRSFPSFGRGFDSHRPLQKLLTCTAFVVLQMEGL
jgi:hypothetical protein